MTEPPIDHRVLITGGAGFIGSHLADVLVPANEVRVVDDLSSGHRANVPEAATFIEGDISDVKTLEDAMSDIDIVFHQAAEVSVSKTVEQPLSTHRTNATGALQVLECARQKNARVVFASSAAVYGRPDKVPVSESDPKRPLSPYGIDKLAADQYVRAYSRLYDLQTVSLRYFNVYGPRQSADGYAGVVRIFIEQAENGGPLTVEGDGTQTRDFVHVSDAVKANLLAATTDHTGCAFNIGTSKSISIRDLAKTVQSIANSEISIIHTEPRSGDIQQSRADITQAREYLGYEPTISLKEGLRTLIGPQE